MKNLYSGVELGDWKTDEQELNSIFSLYHVNMVFHIQPSAKQLT